MEGAIGRRVIAKLLAGSNFMQEDGFEWDDTKAATNWRMALGTEFASYRPGRQNLMNGADTTPKTKHDWSRADAMTEADVHAAAMRDPDAHPMTDEEFARAKPVPRLKVIRRALGLTQEEFARRFQIPLGTLRDWEQGVAQPDQTARAYLRAIAGDANAVQNALATVPQTS